MVPHAVTTSSRKECRRGTGGVQNNHANQVLSEQAPVLFDPQLGGLEMLAMLRNQVPELLSMIHFPQVHQFVNDDVFPD